MKKQISIRISALTEAQLHELTSKLGMTQTEVISHAMENYYQKMEDTMNTEKFIEVKLDREGFVDFLGSEERAERYANKLLSMISKNYPEYEVSVGLYNINKMEIFISHIKNLHDDEPIKNHIENMMNELSNNLDDIL